MIQKTIVTLVASLALAGALFAQQQPADQNDRAAQPGQTAGQPGVSGQQSDQSINQQIQQFAQDPKTACDKLFVLKSAIDNQFEIQLAQQAQQKAQSQQVKDLAQRISQDHQEALQKLQPVAQQLGVQLPQGLPMMKQQEIQIFTSLPSDKFEKQYICMMQAAHARDVTAFQGVAQLSEDQQVKQFAQQVLPKLQEHARAIDQCAVAMGLPGSNYGEAQPAGGRLQGTQGTQGNDRTGSDRNR